MPIGKVKWFSAKKGYGFITGEDGQEVFVHYTDIVGTGRRTLKEGETVRYEVAENGSSLRAVTVVRAGAEKGRGPDRPPRA